MFETAFKLNPIEETGVMYFFSMLRSQNTTQLFTVSIFFQFQDN